MAQTTPTIETRYQWAAVQRVGLTPSLMMFFVGPASAVLVPFSDKHEDRARLLEALKELAPSVRIVTNE
jgi:hypothetical protein